MFTVHYISGDPETALASKNSIVITEEAAERYFGYEEPVGKIITVNKTINLSVTGVIENIPPNSDLKFDFLALPDLFVGVDRMATWSFDGQSFVLLKEGIDLEAFREKISGIINQYASDTVPECHLDIQPFKKMHLYGLNDTGPIVYVYIFSLIAVIVLLIACINFMNLTTAKSSTPPLARIRR